MVKAPPPPRTLGELPGEMAGGVVGLAEEACADLGLPALVLAGGEPGRAPWVVAIGYANLGGANLGGADPDRAEPVEVGHRFSVPGVTALVTATAVLRLVAEGRLGLDAPANDHLRAVRLADDSVTVRELLSHTGGVDNPAPLFGDSIPDLATLMGPVISCGGPRGTVQPSNGGYAVLGQLIADVTGLPYADAAIRLVLDPLGMRDSRFPARPADIGPGAVTGYTVTADGAFEPFPPQVATVPAIAGLWSTGADLVRLGTGWSVAAARGAGPRGPDRPGRTGAGRAPDRPRLAAGPRRPDRHARRGRARCRRVAAQPRPRPPDPRGPDQPGDNRRVHRRPPAAHLDQSHDTIDKGMKSCTSLTPAATPSCPNSIARPPRLRC